MIYILFYVLFCSFVFPIIADVKLNMTPVNVTQNLPDKIQKQNISNIEIIKSGSDVPIKQFPSEGGMVQSANISTTSTLTTIDPEVKNLFEKPLNDSIPLEKLESNPGSLRHDSLWNNNTESTVHARKEVFYESDAPSGIKPRKGVENLVPPEPNISVFYNNTLLKPKPKPMWTTDADEPEAQYKNINYTSEVTSSLAGSKLVLPIVIPILALPLVAGILLMIYKRSSEFWEHRHYRRMDFLIDGMYND